MNVPLRHFRLTLAFACCGLLLAQIDRATLTGTVVDSSAAVMPGVGIELRSVDTGLIRTIQSGGNGGYRIPGLPVGAYDVMVQHPGFKQVRIKGIRLQVAQTRTLDITLEPAAEATTIDVQAETADIDKSSSQQGVVVSSAQLTELPVNGRDWSSYMLLAPRSRG